MMLDKIQIYCIYTSIICKIEQRSSTIANYVHKGDLPENLSLQGDLAVDTETKGLNILLRDRLCVVQLSDGNGDAHLVQLSPEDYAKAPRLKALLSDPKRTIICHYARFDITALKHYLGIDIPNIYCTKIASKLTRTYSDKHGLKDLCAELLNVEISKQQQSSDWSAEELSEAQVEYAAADVLHLHALRKKLDEMLKEEGRTTLAKQCFDFLPVRMELDMQGWESMDIFKH